VLEGDDPAGGAFALFLRPHPGAFRQLMYPHPWEFAHLFTKNVNARGLARGGICSRCQSRGWGICNFIAARRLSICVPRGDPRAFDTRVFESAMDEFLGKDEAFVEQ